MEKNDFETLADFVNFFIVKDKRDEYLKVIKLGRRAGNIIASMSNLTCLDAKYCIKIPNGSKADNILFIKNRLGIYNIIGNAIIFSSSRFTNGKSFNIDDALDMALTSGGPTIISFASNRAVFYEGESSKLMYLCIKERHVDTA